MYQYVTAVRDGQHYPLILMDVARDSLLIDQVISEGECLVGFDQDGSLRTHQGFRREEQGHIFHHPLCMPTPWRRFCGCTPPSRPRKKRPSPKA